MTKNKKDLRCIKNRTWEKDRRERLNHTFERLAKLLPDYEPKVTFSKIEILQKTIDYIEKLRLNYHGVSISSDADNSRKADELEESLKALKTHNDKLVDLLQKSKIAIPPFNDKIKKTSDVNATEKMCPSTCMKKLDAKMPEVKKVPIASPSNDLPKYSGVLEHQTIELPALPIVSNQEPTNQLHKNRPTPTTITENFSLSQSTPTHVKKSMKHIRMPPSRNSSDKIKKEHTKKDADNEIKVGSAEASLNKNSDSGEKWPSINSRNTSNQSSCNGMLESRKSQTISLNTKSLVSCDYYDHTKSSLTSSMENGDIPSKSNSLLDDIHSPQIDLSPSLLSPTAAFLLSFPVVSSTLSKHAEPASNYVEGISKVKQNSPRVVAETVKSSDFSGDFTTMENDSNRSRKSKSFPSKDSSTFAQIQDVNNFVNSINASSAVENMDNSIKCTVSSVKTTVANPFVNNTFGNINRPCYDQSYSSFWSESPRTLQTPAHSYGLPYYLRNVPSTSSNSALINNDLAKSGNQKNTTPKYHSNSKNHVNWMTTDSNNHTKVNSLNQLENVGIGYHFPSPSDEILGSASSSRFLDSSNFLSEPALPNLNGDLALSTISTSCIHGSGSGRHSNIQDESLLDKFDKNTVPDNGNYHRVNNFSAESLFSNVASNNNGPDTKRQKNWNEYFSSPQETNSDLGFSSNTMQTTPFFHPSYENLNCTSTNSNSTISQIPLNGLHYTHYAQPQNPKSCNNRHSSGTANLQSTQTINASYKNVQSFASKTQLPFTVPVFRDSCRAEMSLHNQNYKVELSEQNKGIDSSYGNSAGVNKLSKNMPRVEAASNLLGNIDNYLDRPTYGITGDLQPENKIMFSSGSAKSKSHTSFYNHYSSAQVNIQPEPTNSISNTITNFNLSTICPEIERDFLIK